MLMNLSELVVSLVFVVLLLLKLDPLKWLMPTEIQMSILALLVAAAGLYAGIVFRRRARDEREALHLYRASGLASILGLGLLVAGITVQSFEGRVDPWLFYVLGAMVLTRLGTLIWSRFRN